MNKVFLFILGLILISLVIAWLRNKFFIKLEQPESLDEDLVSRALEHEVSHEQNEELESREYFVDKKDANLFYSKMFPDFSIRLTKYNGNPDLIRVSLSLPHFFEENTKLDLLSIIKTLVYCGDGSGFDKSDTHSLYIQKSPAVKWDIVESKLLNFFFLHLYKIYGWIYESQQVVIESDDLKPNYMIFHLRTENYIQVDLIQSFMNIIGISGTSALDNSLGLFRKDKYSFLLEKAEAFSWEELIPKIKQIMIEYFPAGVEFSGFMSEKENLVKELENDSLFSTTEEQISRII